MLYGVRRVATGTALAVSTNPGWAVPSLGRSLFGLVVLGLDRPRARMRGCSWLIDEFGRSAGIEGGGRWPCSRCRVVPLSSRPRVNKTLCMKTTGDGRPSINV